MSDLTNPLSRVIAMMIPKVTAASTGTCCFSLTAALAVLAIAGTATAQEVKNASTLTLSARDASYDASYDALALEAESLAAQNGLLKRLVRTCQPFVAHIEARKTEATGAGGVSTARAAVVEEAGSGVVVRYRDRLFVITNYHVVDGARLNDIRLQVDDSIIRATDIRHDPETDLSVMLLDETRLPAARLGNSDLVEIGEFVTVIGSPFGLSHSVSYGIISASNRRDLELGPQGVIYQDFFQTDASINPGNSGGPLINLRGEVVGINTAIASNSGGSDGIGFAIPINMAMRVVTDLIDHGYVRRGWLGVSMDSHFTPEVAMSLGLRKSGGTRITQVSPGSPAEKAGLQAGDVVLQFNGVRIGSDSHLQTVVSIAPIGASVPVTIYRNGQMIEKTVLIQTKSTAGEKG